MKSHKDQYCRGCQDDFYNHRGDGAGPCWNLKDAEVVTRYRIHWWSPQDTARNYTRVTTLSCHYAPGRYSFQKDLPEHLRHERHLVCDEAQPVGAPKA